MIKLDQLCLVRALLNLLLILVVLPLLLDEVVLVDWYKNSCGIWQFFGVRALKFNRFSHSKDQTQKVFLIIVSKGGILDKNNHKFGIIFKNILSKKPFEYFQGDTIICCISSQTIWNSTTVSLLLWIPWNFDCYFWSCNLKAVWTVMMASVQETVGSFDNICPGIL